MSSQGQLLIMNLKGESISFHIKKSVQSHSANFMDKTSSFGVWEGLRFVIVVLPGLFSYLLFLPISVLRTVLSSRMTRMAKHFLYGDN